MKAPRHVAQLFQGIPYSEALQKIQGTSMDSI